MDSEHTYKTLVLRKDEESGEYDSLQTYNLSENEALLQAFFDDDLFDWNDWENEKYYFDEEEEGKVKFDQCNTEHRKDAIAFILADPERHCFIKTFTITDKEQQFKLF